VHLTAADGTIDLVFQKRHGTTRLLLSGPTSKAQATTFEAGDEVLTVRLRTGVHLTYLDATALTDVYKVLPNAGRERVWLHSHAVPLPDFNTVETFIGRLARANLLNRDVVVEDALADRAARAGLRTIQRHFIATTGLTPNHIRQIRRAEKARSLLTGDSTLTTIAYETGYSNPGHMTNAFKYFFGLPPSTLRTLMTS